MFKFHKRVKNWRNLLSGGKRKSKLQIGQIKGQMIRMQKAGEAREWESWHQCRKQMDEAYRERRNIGQENPECSGCKKEIRTLSSFMLPQLKEGRSTELKSWKDRMVKSVKGKRLKPVLPYCIAEN